MAAQRYPVRVLAFGLGLAATRIVILWLLVFREWHQQQNIAFLPLVGLLYPEGLPLPRNFSWTLGTAVTFSVALLLGSFFFAFVLYGAVRVMKATLPESSKLC